VIRKIKRAERRKKRV